MEAMFFLLSFNENKDPIKCMDGSKMTISFLLKDALGFL